MSWERDPLWAKSRLFFEQAFSKSRDDPLFGLWCAMGLEMLARAALASVSPTLLAAPDKNHKHLLHALNRGIDNEGQLSISITTVLVLCNKLFAGFTFDDYKTALALMNRRNDELHTGAAAFSEYTTKQWIVGFYRCCRSLTQALNETLETLFGKEEAKIAKQRLAKIEKEVQKKARSKVAEYQMQFKRLGKKEREAVAKSAAEEGDRLSHERHHRVTCPACQSVATVQGNPSGKQQIIYSDDSIIAKQTIVPRTFSCPACHLELTGYAELMAAGVGDHFTRTTKYTPEEFYGLVNPEDADAMSRLINEALADMYGGYDNE